MNEFINIRMCLCIGEAEDRRSGLVETIDACIGEVEATEPEPLFANRIGMGMGMGMRMRMRMGWDGMPFYC